MIQGFSVGVSACRPRTDPNPYAWYTRPSPPHANEWGCNPASKPRTSRIGLSREVENGDGRAGGILGGPRSTTSSVGSHIGGGGAVPTGCPPVVVLGTTFQQHL